MTPRARRAGAVVGTTGGGEQRYASGWCGTGRHERCAGAYSGTACACTCHSEHRAHSAHSAGDEGGTR